MSIVLQMINIRKSINYLRFKSVRTLLFTILIRSIEFISVNNASTNKVSILSPSRLGRLYAVSFSWETRFET